MKKLLALLLGCAVFLFPLSCAGAEEKPVEKPEIKFVVNSRAVTLTDVPLVLGGRTLLPLRAVLTALGVPNDDRHIQWNGDDSSVTVVDGESTVFLKVGSKSAMANGKAVELDTAPILYPGNQRVYIPVRFVSNALGKEVVWEDATRTVLVRDRDGYTRMKAVLEKIDKAMEGAQKVKLASKMKLNISGKASKASVDARMSEELDKKAGILHSVTATALFGADLTFEAFYREDARYDRNPGGSWERETMDESVFREKLTEDVSLEALNSLEAMAASLEKRDGPAEGEYILRGGLYPKSISAAICKSAGLESLTPEASYFEAVLDAKTDLVKRLHAEFSGSALLGNSQSDISAVVDVDYTDYDGSFEIKIPEGL